MGKVPITAATEMKIKKKGRPSKNPLRLSTPKSPASNSTNHRSTRRNPSRFSSPPQPEFDDDDEREEKKVKLVVRLPQSDEKIKVDEKRQQQQNRRHSREFDSGSGSGSGSDSEDRVGCAKKHKINGIIRGSDCGASHQDKEVVGGTDTSLLGSIRNPLYWDRSEKALLFVGSTLEPGPATPLPDKKLLVFILGRLQKKDMHGVFSEPVDANEANPWILGQ